MCNYPRILEGMYCTILIDSSGGVTCDQLDEISPPASQHVTWDKPEILANCQNLLKGIICRRYRDPAHIATFSDIKYVEYLFILSDGQGLGDPPGVKGQGQQGKGQGRDFKTLNKPLPS
jgi:hypothetical protein